MKQPTITLRPEKLVEYAPCGCRLRRDEDGSIKMFQCELHRRAETIVFWDRRLLTMNVLTEETRIPLRVQTHRLVR